MLRDEPEGQGDRRDFKAWRESKLKTDGLSLGACEGVTCAKSSRGDTHPLGAF